MTRLAIRDALMAVAAMVAFAVAMSFTNKGARAASAVLEAASGVNWYMLGLVAVLMGLTVQRFVLAVRIKDDKGRDHCEKVFATLVVALCVLWPGNAKAHDWYTGKLTHQGTSCCSGNEDTGDCRQLDRAWPDENGVWHFIYPDSGVEYIVPEDALHDPNENPEPFIAHGCVMYGRVLCFWPKRAGG